MAAELSSAGYRKPVREAYPSVSLLGRLNELGVPLTTASDTHGLGNVANRAPELHELATSAGYSTLRAFRRRSGHDVPVGPAPPSQASGAPVGGAESGTAWQAGIAA